MICRGVYEHALAILGEDLSGRYSDDYLERSMYLIALICSNLCEKDQILRKEKGLPEQGNINKEKIVLSEEFPLCDEFLPAVAYYLASMLIFDEDHGRSDMLFEKYVACVKEVSGSLAYESKGIINKYPD